MIMEKIASSEKDAELLFSASKNYLFTLTPNSILVEDKNVHKQIVDVNWASSFDKGEDTCQEQTPKNDPGFLRFDDFCNKSFSLSVSGLKLISKTSNKFVAVTNRIFSCGSHYWEFFVPKSCNEISFGVVQVCKGEGNSSEGAEAPEFLVSFKTSSDRIVGLKLDLETGELRSWLNGNPQPKKTLFLPANCMFSPAISMFGKIGKVVTLNPFAKDPEEGPFCLFFVTLIHSEFAANEIS